MIGLITMMKVKKNKIKILLGLIVLLLTITSCQKGNIMNDYPQLEDKHHVYKEIEVTDVIKMLEDKDSFTLVMGFPECPWCQAIMPVINDVAKENNCKKVYYLNIKDIRDNEESSGHSDYLQLANNYFKDALDIEKNRLNAPTFVKVEDGIMTKYHIDTVATHTINENMVLPPLTEEQLSELKTILKQFF